MFGLNWDLNVKIEFGLFAFFFWLGFILCGRPPKSKVLLNFSLAGLLELEILLVLLFSLVALANLYLGFTVGFPLLSADPSIAKVTTYTGGLGLIRHLNGGPFLFLCCGCMFLLIVGHRRYLASILLVISSCFIALSGAKGALLPILFIQTFLLHHKGFRAVHLVEKFRKYAAPIFVGAAITAVAVTVRDSGSLQAGLLFLAKRILYYGDVILFYYPRRGSIPELTGAGLFDYLNYLLNPTLGMFRLADYSPPLGTIIAGNLDFGFGPNAQYFVRADIYFGAILGCLYCFLNGYVIGAMRRAFYTLRTEAAIPFTFTLMLAVTAFNLAAESQLFVSATIDAILVIVPLWFVARIIRIASSDQRDHYQRSPSGILES
jgi:hypothetical protein